MAYRLIFTIGSLFFLIILLASYYSKNNKGKMNNKIYKYYLIDTIALLITEILSVVVLEYSDSKLLFDISLKIHWLKGLIFAYFFYLYTYSLLYSNEYKNLFVFIKENKKVFIFTIISVVFIIAFFIIPFSDQVKGEYDFIPGPAAYFSLCYMSLASMYSSIELFKSKQVSKKIRYALYAFLGIVIALTTFQFIIRGIAFFGLMTTLLLFLLYFVLENPDIELIDEIDKLKVSVERSSKAKSEFLSNMSHEIRSPMNAIIGFSETILNDNGPYDPVKTLNDINHIKSFSKTLLDIINNILDISKIETGTDVLELKEYYIRDLLMDWTDIVETRLEGKKIKFILNISNVPTKYYGDSTKIFQIILNLLTNAVKYTEIGRIVMDIKGTKINNETYNLTFKVSDTGFGIKDEDKEKVFQKYSRLDSAKTNEIEGTGLGLALTKRYAELMGGKIWFESNYGSGSKFYFEVAQRVQDETLLENVNVDMLENNKRVLLDCTSKKALIVDDDELSLKVMKRLLSGYNLEVETLVNPNDCIYNIKSGHHYDIIFIDNMMHDISGIDLLKILKSMKEYYIPPIVIVTANALIGAREEFLKEGFDEYLSKPLDMNELDKVINKFLKQ